MAPHRRALCVTIAFVLLASASRLDSASFVRGDANADGKRSLSDAVATLSYLFLGTYTPGCLDSADANDDGLLNIGDAIYTLTYLFLGGAELPPPFASCGTDPTQDDLGCASFANCAVEPAGGFLLSEILPWPLDPDPALADVLAELPWLATQLVELRAVAGEASPGGWRLRAASGGEYTIPGGIEPLAEGKVFLVLFDGQARSEGNTLHADRVALLAPQSDAIELLAPDGTLSDRASWGPERPDGISRTQGGAAPESLSGATFSRLAGTSRPNAPGEWIITSGPQSSPGAPNPTLGPPILFPAPGATLEAGDVSLDWYAPPYLADFHVILSRSSDLSAPILERDVAQSEKIIVNLPMGDYYWNLTTRGTGSSPEVESEIRVFHVVESLDGPAGAGEGGGGAQAGPAAGTLSRQPPLYKQHRDTSLLLLESDSPSGTRLSWNAPHEFDRYDPASAFNCALATISMTNGYLLNAGDAESKLSQDRIGLEVHSKFDGPERGVDPGPERDFNFGRGLDNAQYQFGLNWALGTEVTPRSIGLIGEAIYLQLDRYDEAFREQFWNDLRRSIEVLGQPVPLAAYYVSVDQVSRVKSKSKHAILARGFRQTPTGREVLVNDPWDNNGRFSMPLDQLMVVVYFLLEQPTAPRQDEEKLVNLTDTDEDGVLDFDEEMRFETKWKDKRTDKDSDGDCIDDLEEIERSVFADRHGWGPYQMGLLNYPARASDGKARQNARPEIELDSDGGGLPDFVEDLDHDGELDDGETDPYDSEDDQITVRVTLKQEIELSCPDDGFPTGYHDLTHAESSEAIYELKAKKNANHAGLVNGTVSLDFKGLSGFWVSDTPASCEETGLSRKIAPYTWDGMFDARFVCRRGATGPEVHLGGEVAGAAPPNPMIHEHFCDYDAEIRGNVAPARGISLPWTTLFVPGGKSKPIESDHFENEGDLKSSGCYSGKILWKLTIDLER